MHSCFFSKISIITYEVIFLFQDIILLSMAMTIRYLGPHIWGKISQGLRSKTSLQAFRRGVRALNVLGFLDGTCGYCACSS